MPLLPPCLGLLALLGRAGALAPVLALIAGLALPPLVAPGGNLVGPGVMLLLPMTVAMAEPWRLAREEWRPTLALSVALVLVTPLAALAAMRLAQLPPGGMAGWLPLVAACPPAGTAALVAGYLRRGGRSRRRIGLNMPGPEPAHPPTCGSVRRRCSSSA